MSKTVIELAKQAGWEYADGDGGFEPLWRFAELVRADERAKLAEQPAPVQQETSDLKHLAAICPELNMSNYTSDDVDELNHWAIEVATAIDELAEQPAPAAQGEPIYQCQDSTGKWTDQDKHSYDYNVQHARATVRVVYTSPQAQPAREPLTSEQIDAVTIECFGPNADLDFHRHYAQALNKAAHGITKGNT